MDERRGGPHATHASHPTRRSPSVTSSRVQTQHIAPWCTPVTLLQTRAGRISKAAVAIWRKGVPRLTASRAHGPDYICKALAWDRCGRQSVRSACILPPPQHPDRSHNPNICARLCRGQGARERCGAPRVRGRAHQRRENVRHRAAASRAATSQRPEPRRRGLNRDAARAGEALRRAAAAQPL